MNKLQATWRKWWRQKAITGAYIGMMKEKRWGSNYPTFETLGTLIGSHLNDSYTGSALKGVHGSLHTSTVDELVIDLSIMQRTIDSKDRYVDERLLYVHHRPITLHQSLALMSGPSIGPKEAWTELHAHALSVTHALDTMFGDWDEENDRDYLIRRYRTVLDEVYEVYSLFGRLVGLTVPKLPSP
jgi:hypothetical protein